MNNAASVSFDQATSEPCRIRARTKDGFTDVLVLMPHPMETGLRKGPSGQFVPAHHITEVNISLAGRPVLTAHLSIAVARDPLLSFRFRGGRPGERLAVRWTDNLGHQRSDQADIT
jgi:sulfur-oxidizing protein SoxZ